MSPEEVPDELIELAAHAFHWSYAALVDPEAPPVDYDSLPPSLRERYEQMARHGLTAVLPLVRVDAQQELITDMLARDLAAVEYTVSHYPIRAVPQAGLLDRRRALARERAEAEGQS